MNQILQEICTEYGYVSAKNSSGLTLELVLSVVAKRQNIVSDLTNKLGCSKQTVTNFLKKTFPDRDPVKDRSIYVWLLAKKELKFCPRCEEIKPYAEYYTNIKEKNNLQSYCKNCSTQYRIETYNKDPQKEIVQNSIRKRVRDSKQTPNWAEKQAITEFYRNRPNNCHVDHIIPLNGKNVCGLHILENLQYLTVEQNLKKNNKYEP